MKADFSQQIGEYGMSEYSVRFSELNQIIQDNRNIFSFLYTAASEVEKIKQNLTFEIRQRAEINSRLQLVSKNLEDQGNIASRLTNTLSEVADLYIRTENYAAERPDIENFFPSELVGAIEVMTSLTNGVKDSDGADWQNFGLEQFLKTLKTSYKFDVSDESGMMSSGFGYLLSLVNLFTESMTEITGISNLCDLFDNSVGLWSSAYDYLKDFYHEAGNFFGKSGQKVVGYLGLTGASIGAIASYIQVLDTKGKNLGEIISDYCNFGSSAVPIVQEAYKLDHLMDVKNLATIKSGLFSPADIYTSIVQSGLSFGGQAAESIAEYMQDGDWDVGDTGAMLVDSACEGLYSLGNSMTFGGVEVACDLINYAFGGKPLAEGESYGDRMADGFKAAGEAIGEAIGNGYLYLKKVFS